ncbi:TonB-dependent receptor plug domain-containing protein [Sphingosinicella terrae]|uniref:TonB-dependent receptor plug domain-containing protein n=1 Tax=Sphingosinicella terrae TaxID=2172047 RepID=UPI000E0D6809|nr:TonB-dependent receptor [Sphingosinicella terrae]
MRLKSWLLVGGALSAATPAAAVDGAADLASGAEPIARPTDDPDQAREIIVTGNLSFRNRTEDVNPVLSYDLEYFQRFEPVSVGEMLKRVPGVTFTSDVLEYDGAQMRGLPPGFTNILINGRRAPGGEADRSFFVDRIPAELVERIELVRAPRADQPSDGVAGTLNIITKESATFDGGFLRLGGLLNQDGGVRPSAAAAYAGEIGATRFWAAVNYQERRNPKEKTSYRFSDEVPIDADETSPDFDNLELQEDTRDGTDLSGNFELTAPVGAGRIRWSGLFVDTDRDEDETSITFEGADLELDGIEIQRERISQQTYGLTFDGEFPIGPGELGLAAGWSGFREDTDVEIDEGDDLAGAELVALETLDIEDDEYTGTLSYAFGADPWRLKLGIDLLRKTRDGANRIFEVDGDEIEEETAPGAIFTIRETRYDPYARLTLEPADGLTVDAGLRYEITRRRTVSDEGRADFEQESLNPSVHLRYAPDAVNQLRLSLARTVRRPDYDLISPYRQEEEPGDEDELIGNPGLRNQRAWGVDLGYERRIGRSGIVGVNLFYRDIDDLIELVATGEDPLNGEPGNVYQARNIGEGRLWGVEIDLSTPLDFLGLPDTGFFANYTWLDSETTDPFTGEERRFNNQPHHLYNVGFIQTVRPWEMSFGASLSGRSRAVESNFDETVELRYTPDLEAFVERRFGRNVVLRLSAQNLLNRTKREVFRKYDGDSFEEILDNRAAGDLDEFELERERSGRLFQATLRVAF